MAIRFEGQAPEFVGAVLATRERNGYQDSDFYAVVWDEAKQAVTEVEYGSTRYPGGGDATVDATPEVIAKARAWWRKEREAVIAGTWDHVTGRHDVGDTVEVVGGRKYKGKVGRITWRGTNQFRTYYRNGYNNPNAAHNQRVRIQPLDGSEAFFTDLSNCGHPKGPEFAEARAAWIAERVARINLDGYVTAFVSFGYAVL